MALESSKCPLAVPSPASHAPFPHPVPRSTDLHPLPCGPGKQTLKIFDGNDAVQRNHFRAITVPRLAKSQEVLVRGTPQPPCRPVPGGLRGPSVAWLRSRPPPPPSKEVALRAYYITEDPQGFQLQALPAPALAGNTGASGKAWSGGTTEEESSRGPGARDAPSITRVPEAWIIRALPRTQEVLKIYPAWLK